LQHWYVVQTKPHNETLAVENLQRQGYRTYCPAITLRKLKRKRWQQVTEPLFPRYLFVCLKEGVDDFAPIRSTLGVIGLVRFGGQPATVPEQVITFIAEQEKHLNQPATSRQPDWTPGIELEIFEGPMAGLKGVFLKSQGEERVIILLDVLGKQSRVAVSVDRVSPT
jgi:transcriptional antiterminator RfaH